MSNINVKYTFFIDTGSGYIQFFPNSEEASLIRELENNNIFARVKVDGNLQFDTDEYLILKNLADTLGYVDIKIYREGTLQATGQLNIRNSYNDDIQTIECSVNVIDEYTTLIEERNTDFNIIDNVLGVVCNSSSEKYPTFRIFQEVVTSLINSIDNTILFDNSGTEDDSFYYLKQNNDLKYLLIANISDVVLTEDGDLKDRSTELNLSLSKLDEILKYFFLYWKLEDRSGSYYFKIRHLSEISYPIGTGDAHDLRNYKGVNWSQRLNTYKYTENIYARLKRKLIAGGEDFKGTDIIFPRLINNL